ncbi:MAG TPA: NAD(P)H-dependent glycerol-3-phosphate dehydrogenase [Stellaceae bacterium]|jgi:glycerol-3-phosphate dehydrogenase (NAD(P)+)|nr:NAD(P)H-dependent glycerol-3-phosphate dehydrogenase [Stellaceae bacterium]
MTISPFTRIGVLGAGAWGTALAQTARRAGAEVMIWARSPEVARAIDQDHANPNFLPGITLDPSIRGTSDLADIAAHAQALLLVVPTQYLRGVAEGLAPILPRETPVVIASKGVEIGTGATMEEVIADCLPGRPQAVLSGPTFAIEVARGLPTAVTLASRDGNLGARLVATLGTPSFRPYLSDDPLGCEIGGAVKNVLAIACGIVWGRGLGDNARAALITRGIAEMMRLASAMGARPETLMGLSGVGDLVLTCTAMQSRNCSLGMALGQGQNLAEILAGRRSVAEGVATSQALAGLARKMDVEMPIVFAVDAILHRGAGIDETIRQLLARPFKAE